MSDLFLGFDLSTQQLKVIACEANLHVYKTYNVDFDAEYASKYGIEKGVITHGTEIHAPVAMWIDAVELAFDRMKQDQFPFERVRGLSGSCQQHGSVYWSSEAPELLDNLDPTKPLKDQLSPGAFTLQTAPNWQDHSTGPELELFEKVAGGPRELAQITGSKAHYRFTGTQIRKLATRQDPELYQKTYRISLVSSFLASLLTSKIERIEEADACGMNLYDIRNSKYDEKLLELTAGVSPEIDGADLASAKKGARSLAEKLGPVQPIGPKSVGKVGTYFEKKYGFTNCKVYSFTGDNLATILALPLGNNDILVSMGTSTTVLLVTDQYMPSPNYHIFKHPTIPAHYMGMLCYCNGALAREKVRNAVNAKYGTSGWDKFDEILDDSKPLSGKLQLGIYFPKGEIIPNAKACERRFQYRDKLVEVGPWSVEEDVPSIIESQALSCRLRAGPMLEGTGAQGGVNPAVTAKLAKYSPIMSDGTTQTDAAVSSKPNKVFFVGGSSKNGSIVNKYCEILGAEAGNYRIDLSDACALGGCYKSIWSFETENGLSKEYGKWLDEVYDWREVDTITSKNLWEDYLDGVGILSLAEQQLEK